MIELKYLKKSLPLFKEEYSKIEKNRTSREDNTKIYNSLTSFLRNKEKITFDDIIVGTFAAYGWMPTMMKNSELPKESKIKKLEEDFGKIRLSHKNLTVGHLESIKKITNNSVVGASKLLHLINPDEYAIWDSRVLKFIKQQNLQALKKYENEEERYLDYNLKLHEIINKGEFTEIHKDVENIIKVTSPNNFQINKLRAAELIMYSVSDGK